MPGTLVLCATPIGNLSDASPRLREALAGADVIYAEDTRRSRTLLNALGVSASLRSYHVGNEERRASELQGHLEAGKRVALVTDAGMPSIADPGLSAVQVAVAAEATVTVVPGPSAVTGAIAVSGLPRKQASRSVRLEEIGEEARTVVVFVAPRRANRDLADLAEYCGPDREVVVVRELTKLHEEIWRGTLGEAAHRFAAPRGELTVVIAGHVSPGGDIEAAAGDVAQLVATGMSFSDAVRRAADDHGVRRRDLYEAARPRPET